MLYAPYVEDGDDYLAQLCQVQIFFALLSSVALQFDAATRLEASNMDVLLTTLTFIVLALAVVLETPLASYMIGACAKEEEDRDDEGRAVEGTSLPAVASASSEILKGEGRI